MIEYGATVKNFSAPMKEVEALVLAARLHHDGDPVLGWMISNVVAHVDKKDNVFPNKQTANNKIDGAVALIMAMPAARCTRSTSHGSPAAAARARATGFPVGGFYLWGEVRAAQAPPRPTYGDD
jgi:phage terminase large subunit-like protein